MQSCWRTWCPRESARWRLQCPGSPLLAVLWTTILAELLGNLVPQGVHVVKAPLLWFPPLGSFINYYSGWAAGEPGAPGSPRDEGCSAMVPPVGSFMNYYPGWAAARGSPRDEGSNCHSSPPIGSFMNYYSGWAAGEPGAPGSTCDKGSFAMIPPYWQLCELLFRQSYWGTWCPRESMWWRLQFHSSPLLAALWTTIQAELLGNLVPQGVHVWRL